MAQWLYIKDGEQHGPVTATELKRLAETGRIGPIDCVLKDGMAKWVEARNVKGLCSPSPSGKYYTSETKPAFNEDEVRWYYVIHNEEHGPITCNSLRYLAKQRIINRDDFVWNSALDSWIAASSVAGLLPRVFRFKTETGITDPVCESIGMRAIKAGLIKQSDYFQLESEESQWMACANISGVNWSDRDLDLQKTIDIVGYNESFYRAAQKMKSGISTIYEEGHLVATYSCITTSTSGQFVVFNIAVGDGQISFTLDSIDNSSVDTNVGVRCELEWNGSAFSWPPMATDELFFAIDIDNPEVYAGPRTLDDYAQHIGSENEVNVKLVVKTTASSKSELCEFTINAAIINRLCQFAFDVFEKRRQYNDWWSQHCHSAWKGNVDLVAAGIKRIPETGFAVYPGDEIQQMAQDIIFFDTTMSADYVPANVESELLRVDSLSSDQSESGKREAVYILVNEAMPGLIKIGFTNQGVSARMNQLNSTGVAKPFECFYAAYVEDMAEVESFLHQQFSEHRVNDRREFFKLEPREAHRVLAQFAIGDATFS